MAFVRAESEEQEDVPHQFPLFNIGTHETLRELPLSDLQYGHLLNQGVNFVTTSVTNSHFRNRVFQLTSDYLSKVPENAEDGESSASIPMAEPIVSPLTAADTTLSPSPAVSTYTAYISPWIDLCSLNPVITGISRQVLNMEVDYASFCGIRTVILPAPSRDASQAGGNQALAQYARAVLEALSIGSYMSFSIHMPMCQELVPENEPPTLFHLHPHPRIKRKRRDMANIFSTWDTWNQIRSFCRYHARLFVALKLSKAMPEIELRTRWFSEPVHFLTIGLGTFRNNQSGFPCLSTLHQETIASYMRLKTAPWLLLCDIGPNAYNGSTALVPLLSESGVSADGGPSTAGAGNEARRRREEDISRDPHLAYIKWLEVQQLPFEKLETPALISYQDWLQSPLQPLTDNLESATYEVFEGDPVKYNRYEAAMVEALREWTELGLPTSQEGKVVMAIAGSGRGPLVTRALKASRTTGVPIEVWALEKNPNACVYLLRQNQTIWEGRVKVVKTDMRDWKGPLAAESTETEFFYGKVDILVSELLGSFGDNELSPECLDGIQHVLSKPYGISIPRSYSAYVTPISTPKVHAAIQARSASETTAFDTPWVVRLYAFDYLAHQVPDRARFQKAWTFSHPIAEGTFGSLRTNRSLAAEKGGRGSMAGSAGVNEHNSRHCHLTFFCRFQGVVHGLAGFFESTLYQSRMEGKENAKVEISTHPERMEAKSKDMISWFPIFFPLQTPLNFPADTELEVSMWRQTDDSKVWYEWLVEAWAWIGPKSRVRIGTSALGSSRSMACKM